VPVLAEYITSADLGFDVTQNGPTIVANLNRCAHTEAALDVDLSGGTPDTSDAGRLLDILAGFAFFVKLEVSPTNSSTDCQVSVVAWLSTPRDDVTPLAFIKLDHESDDVLTAIADGSVVPVGSHVDGTVFEMERDTDPDDIHNVSYQLDLLTTTAFEDVGISVVSANDVDDGTIGYVQLYAGTSAEHSDVQFESRLSVSVPSFTDGGEDLVALSLPSDGGYNPKLTLSSQNTTTCKIDLDLCDVLPCGDDDDDQYLEGTCTLETNSVCLNRTVCTDDQYATNVPTATTNRICVATTTATTTLTTTLTSTGTSTGTTTQTTTPTTFEPTSSPSGSPSKAPTDAPSGSPTTFDCEDGQIAIPQITGDVCRVISLNFTQELQITASVTGQGGPLYFPKNVPLADSGDYESSGVLSFDTQGFRIAASLLPLSTVTTSSVTTSTPVANHLEAVLLTSETFEDDRIVRIRVQLRNNVSWSTKVAARTVNVTAIPDSELASLRAASSTRVVSCGPATNANGICNIDLTLNSAWFAPLDDGAQGHVEIVVGFADEQTRITLGSTAVVATADLGADDGNTLFVDIPTDDHYPGNVIDLEIVSLFRTYVDGHIIRVDLGPGLVLLSGASSVSNGNVVFSGDFSINTQTSRSGTGSFLRIGDVTADEQSEATEEALLRLRVRVGQDAVPGSAIDFNISIRSLRDSDGDSIVPESPALIRSRVGVSRTGSGTIHIGEDADMGFFVDLDNRKTEYLNLAVLTGVTDRIAVNAFVVTRRGRRVQVTDRTELGCTTTTDSSIVSVISSCRVSVTGDETAGSDRAEIDVSYGSYNRTLPMRVLFPSTVTLSADDTVLSPIAGWFDEDIDPDCGTFKYQSGQMRAVIQYGTDPDDIIASVDVTSALTGRWTSGDTDVATVDNDGVVTAVTSGTSSVGLAGATDASINVTVSDAPILVIGLDVTHLSSIQPVGVTLEFDRRRHRRDFGEDVCPAGQFRCAGFIFPGVVDCLIPDLVCDGEDDCAQGDDELHPSCTVAPTAVPTSLPSTPLPTSVPTSAPSAGPTAAPTQVPTDGPTAEPTTGPSREPSSSPTCEAFACEDGGCLIDDIVCDGECW